MKSLQCGKQLFSAAGNKTWRFADFDQIPRVHLGAGLQHHLVIYTYAASHDQPLRL